MVRHPRRAEPDELGVRHEIPQGEREVVAHAGHPFVRGGLPLPHDRLRRDVALVHGVALRLPRLPDPGRVQPPYVYFQRAFGQRVGGQVDEPVVGTRVGEHRGYLLGPGHAAERVGGDPARGVQPPRPRVVEPVPLHRPPVAPLDPDWYIHGVVPGGQLGGGAEGGPRDRGLGAGQHDVARYGREPERLGGERPVVAVLQEEPVWPARVAEDAHGLDPSARLHLLGQLGHGPRVLARLDVDQVGERHLAVLDFYDVLAVDPERRQVLPALRRLAVVARGVGVGHRPPLPLAGALYGGRLGRRLRLRSPGPGAERPLYLLPGLRQELQQAGVEL